MYRIWRKIKRANFDGEQMWYNIFMNDKTETLRVRVSAGMMQKLKQLSKRRGISISEATRAAITDYLISSRPKVIIPLTPDTVEEVARIFRQEMKKIDEEKQLAEKRPD